MIHVSLLLGAFELAGLALANSPPSATNVPASQPTDGTKLVDTRYSLTDFDGDDDVDQTDFGVLQRCLSGDQPADPSRQ